MAIVEMITVGIIGFLVITLILQKEGNKWLKIFNFFCVRRRKMNIIQYVGNKIKELRNNFNSGEGLSQTELAKMMKVSTNTISRWETGNNRPSIEELDKLSRVLGVSILVFFPKEEIPADNKKIMALFRAVDGLNDKDLDEVQKYAEFRKARSIMNRKKRPPSGRKRKDEKSL